MANTPDNSTDIRGASALMWCIIAMIVTTLLWAGFGQIVQHVKGQGRISPSGKIRLVQHLEGGVITDILAKEGERVVQGQPLFIIDSINSTTDKNETTLELHRLTSTLIRLEAERANAESPVFPADLTTLYPAIIAAELSLFAARKREFQQELAVLQDQIEQKTLKLENLNDTYQNINSELSTSLQQQTLSKKLLDTGSGSKRQFLDAQSRVQNFRTRLSQIKKDIPIVQSEQQEIKNKLVQTFKRHESEIIEEINEVSFKKKQIEERLNRFDDQIKRAEIKSPVTGILNTSYVNTIGGVIQPAAVMAEILPLKDDLLIEGHIGAQDRPQLYLGLPVTISLAAFDFATTQTLEGTLQQISADSFTHDNGVTAYRVQISIPHDNIPDDVRLYSGMIVDFHISATRVSILSAILKPLIDIRDNALR